MHQDRKLGPLAPQESGHLEKPMLVSVIIPTYNRARTIERAVNSVLNQTWKQIEVIVVDDGSTDQTTEILKGYGDKIRAICQKNGGPGAARNTGIKAATGDIISFLDSDDEWLPSKVERQVKLLRATQSSGVVCCICSAKMNFSAGAVDSFTYAGLHPAEREGIWMNPAEVLATRFVFFNQVAAVRREALEQTGYFRSGVMEDYDFALRLSLVGPWAFITDPLVEWHEHTDNMSRAHSQLAICTQTLQILKDINDSPRLRVLLPQRLLNRRLRRLSHGARALRLSNESNALARLFGRFLLLYLRGADVLYWRLPSAPRMVTRPL